MEVIRRIGFEASITSFVAGPFGGALGLSVKCCALVVRS
jgi:hypothetical protein